MSIIHIKLAVQHPLEVSNMTSICSIKVSLAVKSISTIITLYLYSGAMNKSDKAHLGHFLEFTISNSEFEN